MPQRKPLDAKPTRPIVDEIMAFEDGQLDEAETYDLMVRLRDSGMLAHLQGFYGRTAHAMGVI